MIALEGFFGIPYAQALLIVLNLIIIESLLSVDNAAVLASMAMKLPKEQRGKALRYGIIGAYVFRGICLVLAVWLVHFWWLKLVGGIYLLFLTIKHFIHTEKENLDEIKEEADAVPKSKFVQLTVGKIGPFWGTVIAIEVMDLAFSLDNVLAAVAYTENLPHPANQYLLWIGVFIGILAMRFVAQGFVKLMEKFPFLETAAYLVIGLLGLKLLFDGIINLIQKLINPHSPIVLFMENEHNKHVIDLAVSLATIAIFVVPILFALLFRRQKPTTGIGE
jgi:YkoY family integral membrane protein